FQAQQKLAFDEEVARWQQDETETAAPVPSSQELEENGDAHIVCADMCGSVWKVLVQPGEAVKAGTPLLVVEAMKMELAVTAPVSGTVRSVRCQPGKAVLPGDTLMLLDPVA
ncbi:acetyl-CoA carboxylase biotin carboxyl carrier protein subunit, partial [Pseudomonas aeruginosa]